MCFSLQEKTQHFYRVPKFGPYFNNNDIPICNFSAERWQLSDVHFYYSSSFAFTFSTLSRPFWLYLLHGLRAHGVHGFLRNELCYNERRPCNIFECNCGCYNLSFWFTRTLSHLIAKQNELNATDDCSQNNNVFYSLLLKNYIHDFSSD